MQQSPKPLLDLLLQKVIVYKDRIKIYMKYVGDTLSNDSPDKNDTPDGTDSVRGLLILSYSILKFILPHLLPKINSACFYINKLNPTYFLHIVIRIFLFSCINITSIAITNSIIAVITTEIFDNAYILCRRI